MSFIGIPNITVKGGFGNLDEGLVEEYGKEYIWGQKQT